MELKWRQVDDYHAIANQGGYRVCRIHFAATVFYEAWRDKTFLARAEDSNSAAMRSVCESDWLRISPESHFEATPPMQAAR